MLDKVEKHNSNYTILEYRYAVMVQALPDAVVVHGGPCFLRFPIYSILLTDKYVPRDVDATCTEASERP